MANTEQQQKGFLFPITNRVNNVKNSWNEARETAGGTSYRATPAPAPPPAATAVAQRQPPKGELDNPTNAEQWLGKMQNFFNTDTAGANRMAGLSDAFNPGQLSYQEQLYGSGPGLDEHYDREFNKGMSNLNRQFGSRGFGSTAHANALTGFGADLYADKAFREAEFRQNQAAGADAGRASRYNIASELASGADNRSGQIADYGLNKLEFGQGAVDSADEARYRNIVLSHKMQQDMLNSILGFDFLGGLDDYEKYMDASFRGNISASEDKATGEANNAKERTQAIADGVSFASGKPPTPK